MKDSGRLDESRVKDGRAVLSATLYSRGLHPEERVVRVVDAVEYDRGEKFYRITLKCGEGGYCYYYKYFSEIKYLSLPHL